MSCELNNSSKAEQQQQRRISTDDKLRLSQKHKKRERTIDAMTNTIENFSDTEISGWLQKWTNYVKGYQQRWFVLSNGVICYYLNPTEVKQNSRGSLALKDATIEHVDATTFAITDVNKQTYRLKAETPQELQSWLKALEQTMHSTPPKPTGNSRQRRTCVPDKPNYPLNLWSIMKNCIGKDLSKIPMPVNFNEPLSMLQRLVEDYEYADILDTAANCTDECEQLAYLAAFSVSAYATTTNRAAKPFNPLLGETYECDRRDDLGWRCISEQVSHHPPIAALHCEGRKWLCWQDFSMTSKFRGKYFQINPLGSAHIEFPATGHHYSWHKVTTTVHNIIVGKLWVDQHGETVIKGSQAAEGIKCVLNYYPHSYFSREQQRCVKGKVINRRNEVKWLLRGTWDDKIEIAPVLATSGPADNPSYSTGEYKIGWQRRMPPAGAERFYNLTTLACQLNEPEEGVAPTDSRMRPDQRLMENGAWDESNDEKLRLEEKQRRVRKEREQAAAKGRPFPPYEPKWFKLEKQQGSEESMHVYQNKYWQAKEAQDWRGCPDIF
ncbi:oxysterol-binding protein 1-like [Drosophila busckii]|uniref:oxysterol-binding protein 1-like n=1 Tax=Drosophila busckii TaxID=30019 RepID=UPI00083EAEF4|nr:oxysterol-binding protein 1-like [Drosophila busckii]